MKRRAEAPHAPMSERNRDVWGQTGDRQVGSIHVGQFAIQAINFILILRGLDRVDQSERLDVCVSRGIASPEEFLLILGPVQTG